MVGLSKPNKRFINVLFPEPVLPIIPIQLPLAISKFIKILYEDHNSIVSGHYRWSNEKGRKCFLSSIGLSSINIPLKMISALLNNYAIHVELNEIKEKC